MAQASAQVSSANLQLVRNPCRGANSGIYCPILSSSFCHLAFKMGAKCCAGQETKDGADAGAMRPKASPMDEETVKSGVSPIAANPSSPNNGKKEFTITVKKTQGGPRLGVDVDLSDGVVLLIDKVNDGLVSEWNKNHPEKEVRKDDRVISVNGHSGNAQELAEICKKDEVLNMVIERDME
uniref:PDZ domain-containing protein n=1 Tax=Pyrodinium bahamense TaxID=73915 RepID=A0A7S0FLH5_9DINO